MSSYKNDKDQTVKIEFNQELPLTTVLAGKTKKKKHLLSSN